MRLLLDTHAFLWWLGGDVSLSERRYITAKNEFVVSAGVIRLQAEEICLRAGDNWVQISKDGVTVVGLPVTQLNPSDAGTVEYWIPTLPHDARDPIDYKD